MGYVADESKQMTNIGSTKFVEVVEILISYSIFGTTSKEKHINNKKKVEKLRLQQEVDAEEQRRKEDQEKFMK